MRRRTIIAVTIAIAVLVSFFQFKKLQPLAVLSIVMFTFYVPLAAAFLVSELVITAVPDFPIAMAQ